MMGPDHGCVTALAFDEQRRLWIGHTDGVRRVDRNGVNVEWAFDASTLGSSTAGATTVVARPLLQAGNRMLAALSDGRIAEIGADDRWRYLPGWAAITRRPIESMTLDPDGSLWVGQSGRITRSTAGRLAVYTVKDGAPVSIPRVLHPDRRGGVWIGTYGSGLLHFRPGRGSRAVPLPDETVSGFVVDSAGLLWMPGNRGLTVMPIRRLAEWVRDSSVAPDARLLTDADGVLEGNNGYPAGAVVDGRYLAYASIDGLVIADLSLLPSAAPSTVVLIDRMVSARRTLEVPRVVRLETDERTVDIEYTMPVYRSAGAVQFRYRLVGRDDGWIPLGAARRLQLAALPPRRFTLELQGRAPGGSWRQAEPLRLDVVPYWHERSSVRVLSVAVLCALLFALYAQRLRTIRARNEAVQLSINARREAAELTVKHQRELAQVGRMAVAGELTASLSHELGQPLAKSHGACSRDATNGRPSPPASSVMPDAVVAIRRRSAAIRMTRMPSTRLSTMSFCKDSVPHRSFASSAAFCSMGMANANRSSRRTCWRVCSDSSAMNSSTPVWNSQRASIGSFRRSGRSACCCSRSW